MRRLHSGFLRNTRQPRQCSVGILSAEISVTFVVVEFVPSAIFVFAESPVVSIIWATNVSRTRDASLAEEKTHCSPSCSTTAHTSYAASEPQSGHQRDISIVLDGSILRSSFLFDCCPSRSLSIRLTWIARYFGSCFPVVVFATASNSQYSHSRPSIYSFRSNRLSKQSSSVGSWMSFGMVVVRGQRIAVSLAEVRRQFEHVSCKGC